MTTIKFLIQILLITLCSCAEKPTKYKVDSAAVELNNQIIPLVRFIENADSSQKAISLLDKATVIDSNYFLGYLNKLMFLNQLKQWDKAILTTNKLIQLKPNAHDLYLTGGIFYERIKDTISSKNYFERSIRICDKVLDTMNFNNPDFLMLNASKAANLTMLNRTLERDMMIQRVSNELRDINLFDADAEKALNSL